MGRIPALPKGAPDTWLAALPNNLCPGRNGTKNHQLQQQVSENEKAVSDDNAGYADKLKRLAELVKYQLNPDRFVKVKFSDEVKIPINTLQLLIKKIDEEYVL